MFGTTALADDAQAEDGTQAEGITGGAFIDNPASAMDDFWLDDDDSPSPLPLGEAKPAEALLDAQAEQEQEQEAAPPDADEPEVSAVANPKPRIAVLEFDVLGNLGIADAGSIIAEWMIRALQKTGQFRLMERVLLNKVLEEQELQSSYLVDQSSMAARAGEMYGVDAIVSGSVSDWAGTISISARLVDTNTSEIIETADVKTRRRDQIPDKISLLARQLAGPSAPKTVSSAVPEPVDEPMHLSGNPARLHVELLPGPRIRLGENMRFRVSTAQPGHLLVFNIDVTGELSKLYPFPCFQQGCDDVWLAPNRPLTVPGTYDGIQLTASEPSGRGHLIAVLSSRPVSADDVVLTSTQQHVDAKLRWTDSAQPPDDYSIATASYVIVP
ncbi:DUF4384 domain-containing protein [Halochromatium salexigens]|uniref:DUF4384 domain-containing protein n=1 Tax=Halochromatium salexigens TaxID=49447 RepID=UPI00191492BA|nr:DUF4384 domain-containing protein [Halochromatium salexigens]